MNNYILLLTNGEFASFNQTMERDVDVIPAPAHLADGFLTLEEARKHTRGINTGVDGVFTIHSEYKVELILKVYSLE